MAERLQEKHIPDYILGIKNSVVAAYVTGHDILELDNPELVGVPFLFHPKLRATNPERRNKGNQLNKEGVLYLDTLEYRDFLLGVARLDAKDAKIPETVRARNAEIPLEELVKFENKGEFRIVQVPYSFDEHHEQDLRDKIRVRSVEDYENMYRKILPEVRRMRKEEAEKEFYANMLNKFFSAIGFGAPPEPPITFLYQRSFSMR